METYKKWKELSETEKEMAIENYMAIREIEEQKICSKKRAEDETPFCKGFWVDFKYGFVTCNI